MKPRLLILLSLVVLIGGTALFEEGRWRSEVKTGELNAAAFMAEANREQLIASVTLDPESPNAAIVQLQRSWNRLSPSQKEAKMAAWGELWYRIITAKPAGESKRVIDFLKPDGGEDGYYWSD